MNGQTASLETKTLIRTFETQKPALEHHRRRWATADALTPVIQPPRSTAARLTAVVVNYNAGTMLCECVDALLASTLATEVIVVDNHSDDISLATLEAAHCGDKRVHVIPRDNNGGFAVAANVGLREARNDWVAIVNPDCIVAAETLERLITGADATDVGMIGGLLLNADGSEQRGCRRHTPTPRNALARVLGLHRLFGKRWDFNLTGSVLPEAPVEIDAISGALMVVRRSALEEVGTLDEGYFLHCEDLDWCRRFAQKGWRVRFVPDAVAVHHQGACSSRAPLRVLWHKHQSMIRYFRKFHGRGPAALLVTGVIWCRFTLTAGTRIGSRALQRLRLHPAAE